MLPAIPQRKDTAEIRWFFREPPFLQSLLFSDAHLAQPRVDWYAFPCDRGCGIKLREGRLETKMRVRRYADEVTASVGLLSAAGKTVPVSGKLESWCKWSVAVEEDVLPPTEDLLRATGWVEVHKERFLRTFAIDADGLRETNERPASGCDIEWTNLRVAGRAWWTVGLEAVGSPEELPDYVGRTVRDILCSVVPHDILRASFSTANSFGYPDWLWSL